ncbi:endonuclease [Paraglaciecola Antarctic GD virus 1]|nr:endonuclease [Paraglaciecola Antarctic GD virus 1]
MKHYTYMITNTKTNMKYIGARTSKVENLLDDLKKYKSSSRNLTFIMEQKKSPEDFEYTILSTFDDRKSAINHEIELHNTYDVARNKEFYNMAKQTCTGFDRTGTTSVSGPLHHRYGKGISEHVRLKLLESNLGRKLSPEHIQKGIDKRTGTTRTEEAKAKMSKAMKGLTKSEAHRLKLREANLGKKLSEETKAKIGKSSKGTTSQLQADKKAYPVKCYGVLYRSGYDAASFLGLSVSSVRRFSLDESNTNFIRFEKGYIAKHSTRKFNESV